MNPPYDELLRRMREMRDNAMSVYPVNFDKPEPGKTSYIMVCFHGGTTEKLADFGDYYQAYLVADLINELLKLRP